MTRAIAGVTLVGVVWLAGCATPWFNESVALYDVPQRGLRALELTGRLPKEINESSGLARSSLEPGVFWTHNDDTDPRLFPVRPDGTVVAPGGVTVQGVPNVDWEDLANDFNGHLLIGDIGNNRCQRRDLVIYQVPEPDPLAGGEVGVTARWPVHYPEQTEFPADDRDFDAEALFVAGGEIYVITKRWSDNRATLYRLPTREEAESNALEKIALANLRGMVTAAASWNDGERVAVLTYVGIWLFEPPEADGARLFEGPTRWLPIRAGQCEAVAFLDADTLVLTNEQRDIYELPVAELIPVERR